MAKTILLTGGAGYIGSVTGYLLHKAGYHIVVIDSLHHKQSFVCPWAHFIKDDIGNVAALESIFKTYSIDAVMHFAGSIEVGESVKDPALFYHNNVIKSLVLFDAMRRHHINNLIFSSSCAVYGVPQYLPLDEKHPLAPSNPYGKTKLAVEYALHDYACAYGLRYVALRYFNAAGALPTEGLGESHDPESHVIPLLLRAIHNQTSFTVLGNDYDTIDGTCIRDYIHVYDLATAHIKALEYLHAGGLSDAFNVGTGAGCSVGQLVDIAVQVSGKQIQTVMHPRRSGDVPVLLAQANKARDVLQWVPMYADIATIVRDAWTWECLKHHIIEQAPDINIGSV